MRASAPLLLRSVKRSTETPSGVWPKDWRLICPDEDGVIVEEVEQPIKDVRPASNEGKTTRCSGFFITIPDVPVHQSCWRWMRAGLAVIRSRPVFAKKMLIQEGFGHGRRFGIE